MIEYFPPGTKVFEGGTLLPEAFSAIITHSKNSNFDLEFKYPLKDNKYKDFLKETIFYADVPYLGKQAFYLADIKKRKNYVEVYAKHIFFLNEKNVTKDISSLAGGDTGQLIMERYQDSLQIPNNFNFYSNITERHVFNEPGYSNAFNSLVDGRHSILGQWGGVLVMDNWDVKLLKRFGRDTEYLVAKRKNIDDIEIDEDSDKVITRLFLSADIQEDVDGETIDKTITTIVDSPLIYEYPYIYGEARETTDDKIKTVSDLKKYGEDIFRNQRIDLPNETFDVKVTDEVKEYKFTIDDTALVYYEDYDIYKRIEVQSYEYDPMQNKYLKVVFGDKGKTLSGETVGKMEDEIDDMVKPSFDKIEEIIKEITKNLGNPEGGIVKFRKDNKGNINEILIVDNEDLELAMDIWRLNIQGISHSSNGINGRFDVAMTQDGKIVADFIATGTLNAALIKLGILASQDNSSWIDMENGDFNFKDNLVWDNKENKLKLGKDVEMQWESIVDPPDLSGDYTDTDALKAWEDSGYATNINNNGIYTGRVVANQILIGGANGTISFNDLSDKPSIPTKASDIGAHDDGWRPQWWQVQNRPTIPDDNYITNISKNAITTAYINSKEVTAKSVLGGTIRIGNSGNTAFRVWSDGDVWAANGNFRIDPAGDGVYNNYAKTSSSSDTSPSAARWKRSDGNYFYQDLNEARIYIDGRSRFRLRERDGISSNWALTLGGSDGATIKTGAFGVQLKDYLDSDYVPVRATEFNAQGNKSYSTYNLLNTNQKIDEKSKLDIVKNAPISEVQVGERNYQAMMTMFNTGKKRITFMENEIPDEVNDEGAVSLVNMTGVLWSAVQELSAEVDKLKGVK